jgi:mannose-6-phosphate isomerase-like protein (cupin superfamily)
MQAAWLEAGTLHYTVVSGEVAVTRAAGPGTPAAAETLTSGHSTDFHPGDSWVEPQGMVHNAENAGTEPVVILVASLLAANEPPAIVVATPTAES